MLSYRHGFHAGNPADVFKHTLLLTLITAMQHKDKGILFIDTHAGSAIYDLSSPSAGKNREFARGIGRLMALKAEGVELPAAYDAYLALVEKFNLEGGLKFYPGSPAIFRARLRSCDTLLLCEQHPAEFKALKARFAGDRQVRLHAGDGYQALAAALPPPSGRGLIFIDSSWERKDELRYLTSALKAAFERFAHGVYAIWYPLISGRSITLDPLPAVLGLSDEQWLDLVVQFPAALRLGRMTGSGLMLINCPYRAREAVSQAALQSPFPQMTFVK